MNKDRFLLFYDTLFYSRMLLYRVTQPDRYQYFLMLKDINALLGSKRKVRKHMYNQQNIKDFYELVHIKK